MEPPQPTFSFLTLIHHLVKQSHDELKRCVVEIKKVMEANDQSTRESSDREALMKKQILYQYFQETRERFIRLLVLLRWSKKSKKTLDKLNQVASSMEMKANAFDLAAFTLFFTSKKVGSLIEPVFDLPTAIDVLTTGTYPRLPNIMQQVCVYNYDIATNIFKCSFEEIYKIHMRILPLKTKKQLCPN